MKNAGNNRKQWRNRSRIRFLSCVLLCMLLLSGCGRSLVITTGFGRGEVFRIGGRGCKTSEVRVYMLDLQKESERLFGNEIWEGSDKDALQEAVKEQALAQVMRVKTLNRIGVSRNVMLTNQEERLAEEAEHTYYEGLSDPEKKYLGLDEKNLQRMFREYALAEKTWKSLGEDAEKAYDGYLEETQCDLNTAVWQKVTIKKLEGDLEAPGFAACYRELFSAEDLPAGSQETTEEQAPGKE